MKTSVLSCQLVLTLLLCLESATITFASENDAPPQQSFDLAAVAEAHPSVCAWRPEKPFADPALIYQPRARRNSLTLWMDRTPLDWTRARYLVGDVWNPNPFSAILYLEFFERQSATNASSRTGSRRSGGIADSPRLTAKIGVLPRLKTRIVFPLSYLDGQKIFLPRVPRQLKGTVQGNRLDPHKLAALRLRLAPVDPPAYRASLTIAHLRLTNTHPAPLPRVRTPYVDRFGQWARKDWPGKVHSARELKAGLLTLERETAGAAYPTNWSVFGGWKNKRFHATGFFRTHNDGRRWWLVDPEGYAFLSLGIDCVQSSVAGPTRGQKDLFAWLPAKSDSAFRDAVSPGSVDFLRANLIRVFGSAWPRHWETLTHSLFRYGRFNTVANWSDLDFARRARIPYVLPLSGFPHTRVAVYRDFPDVFSKEYATAAARFARQLEPVKNDRYLIGYFLSNEPHWAFGRNNLALEMFGTVQPSATKTACVAWLQKRYGDNLAHFNRAWGLALAAFADLETNVFDRPPSARAKTDLWDFSGVMVDHYIATVCDAVKKVDPHHLNLGMRYAWLSSDLLYRAGWRFDVFSINGYSFPAPPATQEIARRSGKPVMIGEFHFGATDRGLPATGIQGVTDQTQRGVAYRYYVEHGFARPEIVGLHYFQWLDQPITGRFDGENYNIGLLDVTYRPYRELLEAARRAHDWIYRIAAGQASPDPQRPVKAPQIYY